MKSCLSIIAILCVLVLAAAPAQSREIGQYIQEAVALQESGDLSKAVTLLGEAVAEYPENSDLHAFLGLYTGMSAGQTSDYMEAGRLTMVAFETLGKAVALDPENPRAHLFKGILAINVPDFLGRLDSGITDLENAAGLYGKSGSPEDMEGLITSWTMLAEGYTRKGNIEGQRKAYENIIKLAPGSPTAAEAGQKLSKLPAPGEKPAPVKDFSDPADDDSGDVSSIRKALKADPENPALLLKLGNALFAQGAMEEADRVLKAFVDIDDTSVEAYMLLANVISALAEEGYDENIYKDTDYRSRLAFEAMDAMDNAVRLAPEDMSLRFTRGIYGIMFPYFLGKHEQGVDDLEMVVNGEASEDMKSQALYFLGLATRKEGTRYWIDVAKKYPDSQGAKMAYNDLGSGVKRLDISKVERPFVKIDFVLGFQDELAPQTAIWVEDKDGNYIGTIYVSGFSGFAKEKQINLFKWSESSKHENIDGVTGASIDVGHHIFTWDLKDNDGKKIGKGEYILKVETNFWPSGKYQVVESPLTIGKKGFANIVEEGDFIPWLEVGYYPEK